MKSKHIIVVLLTAFFLMPVFSGALLAGEYPEKPVTLIVPVKPGGSHDLNGRIITSVIPTYLGQPMIIKFMPGASGMIAHATAARAKPDGYTLIYSSNYQDILIPMIEKVPYKPLEAFTPVCQTNDAPLIMFVLKDKPWKTMKEVFDYGKANPGKLSLCHSGNWSALFTPFASLFNEAGIDAKFIPYQGGGPTLKGALGGECELAAGFPSVVLSLVKAGTLRPLAIIGHKRHDDFPGVPTVEELGYKAITMARVVLAQKATPPEIMDKLRDAFRKMNDDPTYKKLIDKIGENTNFIDGPDYQKERIEQQDFYKKVYEDITGEKVK